MTTESRRSSYGLIFNENNTFQFDNFAESLGAGIPAIALPEQKLIPNDQSQSIVPQKKQNGFFKRMFVGEVASNRRQSQQDDSRLPVDSSPISLRHRASNLFRKSTQTERAVSRQQPYSPDLTTTRPQSKNREHRLGSDIIVGTSTTSIQEFLNLEGSSARNESDRVNPTIQNQARPTSQIVDAFVQPDITPRKHRPLISSPKSEVAPALSHDDALILQKSSSPKRPRFWERHGSNRSEKVEDPSTVQNIKAKSMFDLSDSTMAPEEYSAYLGKEDPFSAAVRMAFMNLFDFSGISIIKALRELCARLYIRGETQVIDRLIESFSKRWRSCNLEERYLTQDVAYIIAFALIALNTDLHTAGLEDNQKMKKSQFVSNTMQAVKSGKHESEGRSKLIDRSGSPLDDAHSIRVVQSIDSIRKENSLSRSGSTRRTAAENANRTQQLIIEQRDAYLKTVLEDMYVSVKNNQIQQPAFAARPELDRSNSNGSKTSTTRTPLFRRDTDERRSIHDSSNNSVSSFDHYIDSGSLERSASTYGRSVSMYNSQQGSRISLGSRTSSASRFSMRAGPTRGIGFMGSLATAMIREEATSPTKEEFDIQDKQDADLTLSGPPFAKEGLVKHRSQVKDLPRKTKQKGWSGELFAVLEKGELRLFDFSNKSSKSSGVGVGGGNWTEHAKPVADFDLVQTLAQTVPRNATTKQRPHVWSLTLPNGDSHFFEVGTELLIHEWTSTANYWAARITKEPLLGAVDSAEYGWGQILDIAMDNEDLEEGKRDPNAQRRPSQFSMSNQSTRFDFIAAQFPGNKVIISEYTPDKPFLKQSDLSPSDQLSALERHVERLKDLNSTHSRKRQFIDRAFSQGHPNLAKAITNFQRRSDEIHSELVKYSSYITALEIGINKAKVIRRQSDGSQYT